jgi:hypothetical protein
MSAPQVARLQALLSRVQTNRGKPRSAGNGAVAAVASALAAPMPIAKPSAFEEALPVSIDTMPPPAAFAKPQVHQGRPSAEPQRSVRAAIEAEHVRMPDIKPAPRVSAQPARAMPAPARPTAPGATPLEMALEGEVARAADAAAAMPAPAPVQRPEPRPDPRAELEGGAGRILADPTPPQPTRPIVQATTKHPPAQPNSFAELLKRSLALRPR